MTYLSLKEISVEKDLGVYIQDNLRFERQVNETVKRKNQAHFQFP